MRASNQALAAEKAPVRGAAVLTKQRLELGVGRAPQPIPQLKHERPPRRRHLGRRGAGQRGRQQLRNLRGDGLRLAAAAAENEDGVALAHDLAAGWVWWEGTVLSEFCDGAKAKGWA
jgi:hypothetical protein